MLICNSLKLQLMLILFIVICLEICFQCEKENGKTVTTVQNTRTEYDLVEKGGLRKEVNSRLYE